MKHCDTCGTSKSDEWWLVKEEMAMTVCTPCKDVFARGGRRPKVRELIFIIAAFIIIAAAVAYAMFGGK